MKDLEEQRVCIKFCFKLGKTSTETSQMLQQAYGEDCLSRTQCHKWYQCFKSGRMCIEDDPKSGRPSTSMDDDRVEKVLAVIRQNVPRGATVSKEFYLNVLKCLRAAVRRKRPEAWTNNTWILHHDNAPAHASLLCEFLTKHETTVVPQPPYCPDLAPADFFFVPEVEILTKRSPISDGRGDRRKFDAEPSRHLAKHIPGCVPELGKTLGVVYREWRGVLWRRQVWLICK